MRYDHAAKVGNAADVWKHFILLTALDVLVRQRPAQRFRYFDSHCGLGVYRLGRTGEWRSGIGRVLPADGTLASHPHFRLVGTRVRAGSTYYGSWRLVAEYLRRQARNSLMRLFDISPEVAGHMKTARIGQTERIHFEQQDGFTALAAAPDADLVLVDPPYAPDRDADLVRAVQAARLMLEHRVPFLVWYPLLTTGNGFTAIDGTDSFEVSWDPLSKETSMVGCGMLAGGELAVALRVASDALATLAARLGGDLRVTSGRTPGSQP